MLDLSHAEESIALAEAERPAEDLRLLYVALTRAVWHCSLGVAPLVRRRSDKKGETDVHQSALGRLLQKANRWMPQAFAPVLRRYATRISCVERRNTDNDRWQIAAASHAELSARTLQRLLYDSWRVTSYSGLQQRGHSVAQDLIPRLDIDAAGVGEAEAPAMTPHHFPRGASPGTFCTACLKSLILLNR